MTRIKNLYLKIVSKIHEPTKEEILYHKQAKVAEVSNRIYIKLLEEKGLKPEEISEENRNELIKDIPKLAEKELTNIEDEIIKELRKPSYLLLKLNKVPVLDNFIRSIFENIDEDNNVVVIPKTSFIELLEKCNFPKELEKIHVWLDSNIIFCTIRYTTKEELDEALAKNYITVEQYDTHIKSL